MKTTLKLLVIAVAAVSVNAAANDGWSAKNAQMNLTAAGQNYAAARQNFKSAERHYGINTSAGYQDAARGLMQADKAVGAALAQVAKTAADSKAPASVPQAVPTRAPQAVPQATPTPMNVPLQAPQAPQAVPHAVPQQVPQITGVSYRTAITRQQAALMGPSINVAVTSLKPSTRVSVTVNGVTQVTTAAALAKVAPETQVAVPMNVPAFERNPGKGSHNDHGHGSYGSDHGNGAGNAAGTASAHGLGGGAHIGGGSAMGGGFHGSW
ncbi:hypothetical protein [Erwinia sp. S59]|uniref:hypothetical protein n=1 Tax=Erwinia sp. S59 TaxID=2769340 RepID=UPI00190B4A4A|nr:hypothetical protein [Erwinia sp. S59]MBK0092816.1 hypothetical protein [Erwinia sp. S59]